MSTPKTPYNKPALAPPELLAHLISRGLEIPNPLTALHALEYVGYYRLLIYMRPFQTPDPVSGVRRFAAGATFDEVLALYDFDRELRLLCLDAVERIEVALRAAIVSQVAVVAGAHFYLEPAHFERIDAFVDFYQTARREERHLAAKHYRRHYASPEHPPIWAMLEASTFGVLSRLFSGLALRHRKTVALRFGFDERVLSSWFRSINLVRNLCAHHGRLWNTPMHVDQPLAATRLREEQIPTDRLYARLVAIAALIGMVDPSSDWKRRLASLLARYPSVPLAPMGIPPGWNTRPFWRV
ncbi:MAG TPA: Abi family protein [Longimicrobium sp.]|uniref:Abi family protein n=1 Tax=Longimicrobium sp. TaxID=2029185 RepID=UPI002ED9E34B